MICPQAHSIPLLTMEAGALLSSRAFGSGRGGELTVAATEAITIAGQGSGLFSNAFSLGDGGRLFLATPLLTMEGGLIQTGGTLGSLGNAGSLEVQTGRLILTGGAQISSSARGSGRGGAMTVLASDAITISGRDSQGFPSGLFSGTSGRGSAGRLFVSAPTVRLEDGGTITASARGDGRGGDIALGVGTLTLRGDARIDSSTSGAGQGGTITVTAGDVVSLSGRNNGLFSNAAGGGAGGLSNSRPEISTSPRVRCSRPPVLVGATPGGCVSSPPSDSRVTEAS
jgi:large exoprotein involved in heme utilization and adhesion